MFDRFFEFDRSRAQQRPVGASRDVGPARSSSGLIGTALAALALLAIPALATPGLATEWRQERSELGITVYTRPFPGSDIREFKGEGLVGAPVQDIVSLLRTPARFKDWFPNTSESKLVKSDGTVSYQYSVMSIPWPISDRDNVFRSVLQRDPKTGRVEIAVEAAPDQYPEQSGRVRVQKARGSWVLDPRGPGATHVRFQMHLDPGGALPDVMVNARTVGTPFEAIINMRKILGVEGKATVEPAP